METKQIIENRITGCNTRIEELRAEIADLNDRISYELGRKDTYNEIRKMIAGKED